MKEEETYCHYSDLPSPLAYIKDDYIDYDGMGNQGRFPNKKDKIKSSTRCSRNRFRPKRSINSIT